MTKKYENNLTLFCYKHKSYDLQPNDGRKSHQISMKISVIIIGWYRSTLWIPLRMWLYINFGEKTFTLNGWSMKKVLVRVLSFRCCCLFQFVLLLFVYMLDYTVTVRMYWIYIKWNCLCFSRTRQNKLPVFVW